MSAKGLFYNAKGRTFRHAESGIGMCRSLGPRTRGAGTGRAWFSFAHRVMGGARI